MNSVSATGSITSTGIGSGLDVNAIVTELMAVESQPLTTLQGRASALNTTLSAIGQLKSLTSAMRDAAAKLTSPSLWNQTNASSSDSSAVTATTDTGAVAAGYTVSVQKLATLQTISSAAFAASSSLVGEGTLTIELGSYSGDVPPFFTAKTGGSAVSIEIGAGETSLAAIRDKINAAGAGVSASIVNDASGARLALRSSVTGAENAFRIVGSGTSDSGPGLSALSYDPSTPESSVMTLNQAAGNANATVNGINVSSASNTLTGVADGLTLNLLKATTNDVSVAVGNDDSAVKAAVNTFVSAFNSLASYIQTQTKYDASSKSAGTLQGDTTAVNEKSQLRAVINQRTSTAGLFSTLSDVGISMQADGTLAVNTTKLGNALGRRADMKQLLMADGTGAAEQGFMTRYRKLGDAMLNINGALSTRTVSLQAMLKTNSKSQEAMQTRLDQTQRRLMAQYQALDSSMAQLNATSSYLTGQLAAMNKSS